MLNIATNREISSRIYVINLRGRIDSVSARDFENFYEEVFGSGHRFFIFDASRLEFVSSAGIGALVKFSERLEKLDGAAAFLKLNEEIRLIFEFFSLDRRLPSFRSLEEARIYLNEQIHGSGASSLELQEQKGGEGTDEENRGAPFLRDYDRLVRLQEIREKLEGVKSRTSLQGKIDLVSPLSSSPSSKGYSDAYPDGIPEVAAEVLSGEEESSLRTDELPTLRVGRGALPGESGSGKSGEGHRYVRGESEALQDSEGYGNLPSRSEREERGAKGSSPGSQPWKGGEFRVVRCEQCSVNLRTYHPGRHMCPECGIEFVVKPDGSASFYEKL